MVAPPPNPRQGAKPPATPSLFTILSPSLGVLGDIPPNRGSGGQSPPEKPLNYSLLPHFRGKLGGSAPKPLLGGIAPYPPLTHHSSLFTLLSPLALPLGELSALLTERAAPPKPPFFDQSAKPWQKAKAKQKGGFAPVYSNYSAANFR